MTDVATPALDYLPQSQQFLSSKTSVSTQKPNRNDGIDSFDNSTAAPPEFMQMELSSSIKEENFSTKEVKHKIKKNQSTRANLITQLKNSKKLESPVSTNFETYNQTPTPAKALPVFNNSKIQPSPASTEINISQTPIPTSSELKGENSLATPSNKSKIQPSATPNTNSIDTSPTALSSSSQFITFPVGVLNGTRNLRKSMLVRGREDGSQVIEFENWLLPYNEVLNILGFNAQNLPDGRVELRSPTVTTRINLDELTSDPKLGLVFSIQDLKKYFGVGAEFDMREYAIRLDIPQLNRRFFDKIDETPVNLEGLPRLEAPKFSLSSVSQRLTVQGGENQSTNWQGDVSAIGTAFGGSWFLRTERLQFQDQQRWNLAEAQFLRQTETADYIVGSQSPFWSNMGNSGSYWGFTTIQRQGFAPSESAFNTLPEQRLQATQLGRTVTGQAEPGTLVQLVESFTNRLVGEVLVDSNGTYEFDNVAVKGEIPFTQYQVYLYPQGRLTAQPQIREVTLNSVPGQLPKGASALVISVGAERQFTDSLLGKFTDFRGGVTQRWGVSEDLTLGLGAVQNGSVRGLTEIYWQPRKFPLSVALSSLTPGITGEKNRDWRFNSDITFIPSTNFRANFSSNFLGSRFYANWQLKPDLSVFSVLDSQQPAKVGARFIRSRGNAFTFANLSVNTENQWQWNLLQRLGQIELFSDGSETGTNSELAYYFSNNRYTNQGHALVLGYETNLNSGDDNDLLSLNWRYRSKKEIYNGSPVWETELGYGIGSQGSGLLASVSTSIFPGVKLRGRYQGASLTSDRSAFRLEFLPSLNLQGGLRGNNRRDRSLRTEGGILLQAFFDQNANGKRDSGEKLYRDNLNLLISLNNQALSSTKLEKTGNWTSLNLSPNKYRLDLDPAGFPFDWQASIPAYAVEVVAGSYTPVSIPLVPAYTVSGVVKDKQGNALAGATVEAISQTGKKYFSITNSAGVYYLENLMQGDYNLQINGQTLSQNIIKLNSTSQSWKKLNINLEQSVSSNKNTEEL
ncbi:carboxypeptidase-like regulatory domain-containing protein [Rivularia sp. UHCC 0363]|uniref:carboxypeptidase-like regulatory domain-containing protein n=1 Tax=Rivularia sp. UHCC 0363 TaxID=3110244 RepID=UPI002B1F0AB7|nr:carboxypeptidase-like regulatory domain-containing protein [Rivularia sp. UHCC 0363]MEA5593894.1 carboxypeptidase-like regulatory domain-containing protein [Rivularia sp. UHCC 0363]